MKKYLLVLSYMGLGGAERQAINFAKYLQESGREVKILGLTGPGTVCEICKAEGIPCAVLPRGNRLLNTMLVLINSLILKLCKDDKWLHSLYLMFGLARYIERNNYDICISYCIYANTILGFSKKFYKGALYVWFQRDAGFSDSIGGYQKKAIQGMDFVFANSQSGIEWIKRGYGVNATLIYNGVTLKQPQVSISEWRKILKVNSTDIICTMIANLSGAKDHMSLLKVWKLLGELNQGRHLVLVFAGRFDERYQSLYAYVMENELLDSVKFLGQVEDISGLLQVTSMCVFGAVSEGNPNGIIEATMSGLPVVSTDLPEIREIVAEDNYEFLFAKGDIITAANNIIKLAENAELRRRLGDKNREKALRMFSAEDNFSKLIAIVEGS